MIPEKNARPLLYGIVVFSASWAILLLLNVTPALRGAPGWYWEYVLPDSLLRILPLIVVLVGYLVLASWLFKTGRTTSLILTSMLFSVLIALAVVYIRSDHILYELFIRTVDGEATGWHYAGTMLDDYYPGGTGEILARWPEFMQDSATFAVHLQVSPPGLSLIFRGLSDLLEKTPSLASQLSHPFRQWLCHDVWITHYTDAELASAWFGMLMPLWGALCTPLFVILGKISGDSRKGVIAAFLWPLTPSLQLFSYYPTLIFSLISLAITITLIIGLKKSSVFWLFITGVLSSILTFLALSTITLLFYIGITTLLVFFIHFRGKHQKWFWLLQMGIPFVIGFSLLWIACYFFFNLSPFVLFETMFNQHTGFEFSYWPWVWYHFYDFMMLMGFPLAITALVFTIDAPSSWRLGKKSNMLKFIGFSMGMTILVLVVTGIGRGETGRVWLFMWPPLLMLATSFEGFSKKGWRALISVQAVMLLVLASTLRVVDPDFARADGDHPPTVLPVSHSSPILIDAVFADSLALRSVSGEVTEDADGEGIDLILNWEAISPLKKPVHSRFIPVGPDGVVYEAQLIDAGENDYPPTCFSGEVSETYRILLPAGAPAGDWWISFSLIGVWDGAPLPMTLADGSEDLQVGIGPFFSGRSDNE